MLVTQQHTFLITAWARVNTSGLIFPTVKIQQVLRYQLNRVVAVFYRCQALSIIFVAVFVTMDKNSNLEIGVHTELGYSPYSVIFSSVQSAASFCAVYLPVKNLPQSLSNH